MNPQIELHRTSGNDQRCRNARRADRKGETWQSPLPHVHSGQDIVKVGVHLQDSDHVPEAGADLRTYLLRAIQQVFHLRFDAGRQIALPRIDTRAFDQPVGVRGRVDGQADDFVVGYDGQAFLTTLSATNLVPLHLESGPCHALFDFSPIAGQLMTIDPVICQ